MKGIFIRLFKIIILLLSTYAIIMTIAIATDLFINESLDTKTTIICTFLVSTCIYGIGDLVFDCNKGE